LKNFSIIFVLAIISEKYKEDYGMTMIRKRNAKRGELQLGSRVLA